MGMAPAGGGAAWQGGSSEPPPVMPEAPADLQAALRPAPTLRTTFPTTIHHRLDSVAGFYTSEVEALVVVQRLGQLHGVRDEHLVLLAPADALWLRFVRKASRWNRRPHHLGHTRFAPLTAGALAGVLAGAALATTAVEYEGLVATGQELMALALAALTGAMIGSGLVGLLHRQQPQFKAFDRLLRHKLADGRWVVLVHDLDWMQQAGVVALLSQHGPHWTAVSSAAPR